MRIVQLIDSLNPGGAERMAVNIATILSDKIAFSGLVTTREEGDLSKSIDKKVAYIFLNRKKVLDVKALLKMRNFLIQNRVEYLHAHSSSWFFAFLCKLVIPKLKLIWHDHYGNSEFLENRKNIQLLHFVSNYFEVIFSVNEQLREWAQKNLNCKRVFFLPNFYLNQTNQINTTFLKGNEGKRIVCLANLRPQKDHFFLLKIAIEIITKYPDWTFHLVGHDFNDSYSQNLKSEIKKANLEKNVFIYGSCNDISFILEQADIGILTSSSEGLPVALLEYGCNKLPVVITNVGEISSVIIQNKSGFLVDHNDIVKFVDCLNNLIQDVKLREKMGQELQNFVSNNFSYVSFINLYFKYLK